MNPSMQKADKLLTGNTFEWFIKKWLSKCFFFCEGVDWSLVKILKELFHKMYQNSNSGMRHQT